MSINYQSLYRKLLKEKKELMGTPEVEVEVLSTEVPENFNQVGWETTREAVELMLQKMNEYEAVKGKRMTPPFYKTVFHRSITTINELNKILTKLNVPEIEDYHEAFLELSAEIKQYKKENNLD